MSWCQRNVTDASSSLSTIWSFSGLSQLMKSLPFSRCTLARFGLCGDRAQPVNNYHTNLDIPKTVCNPSSLLSAPTGAVSAPLACPASPAAAAADRRSSALCLRRWRFLFFVSSLSCLCVRARYVVVLLALSRARARVRALYRSCFHAPIYLCPRPSLVARSNTYISLSRHLCSCGSHLTLTSSWRV